MTSVYIPVAIQRWLATLGERCEYCQSSERITGTRLETDHILPRALGGKTERHNLCRACSTCNGRKLDQTQGIDPVTQRQEILFNPRQQEWNKHFCWSEDGIYIIGLTATGRATVKTLDMNNLTIVRARHVWVSAGWHPPTE